MIKRTGVLMDITEYEPLKKSQAALKEAKDKVARLETELEKAKAEAQTLEEEAIRLAVLADMGESENKTAKDAEKKAVTAKKTAQELEEALRRARIEVKVKEDIVQQKDHEARQVVASTLKNAHKQVAQKLLEILAQAVETNQQIKEIEKQWYRLKWSGSNFDGLPGTLPSLSWSELLPEQRVTGGDPGTGGAIVDTKYSLWVKELRRYGYAE